MKRFFSLVLALLLCLSLFACGAEESLQADRNAVDTCPPAPVVSFCPPAQDPVTPPEEPVPADPLPGEQVAPEVPEVIFGDYNGRFVDGSGTIEYVRVEANLPHMESLPQIHDYYQTLWEDLKATYALNREDAARHKADMEAMGQEFIPWTVEITFDVTRNDGVTLSVVREIYEQLGGPYPTVSYLAETFDVASQGRLLLGDLFQPDTDYLSRLPVTEPDQLNFALTDGFLMLCTEDGTVSVPLSDLSDILLPQYVTE